MSNLAKKAFAEGFARRQQQLASGLVKSAIPSRAGMFIDPRRAPFVEALGRDLFKKVKSDKGLLSGLRASMLGGYEGYDRLGWAQRNYVDQMRALQKKLRAAKSVGSATAVTSVQKEMARAKATFNDTSKRLYQEVGTTAEGRMPIIDTALPAAGAAGLAGAGAYGVGSALGHRDQKLEDAQQLSQMPLLERLRHVFAPQSVALRQYSTPSGGYPSNAPQR